MTPAQRNAAELCLGVVLTVVGFRDATGLVLGIPLVIAGAFMLVGVGGRIR